MAGRPEAGSWRSIMRKQRRLPTPTRDHDVGVVAGPACLAPTSPARFGLSSDVSLRKLVEGGCPVARMFQERLDTEAAPVCDQLVGLAGDSYDAVQVTRANRLTGRQVEVLRVLGEGVTEREVGRRMRISERSVQLHVSNICRALGVRSHFQLGIEAARLGLI